MTNYFGGVVTALMAWPISYLLFSSSDGTARITSSTILAVVAGIMVALFTKKASSKSD